MILSFRIGKNMNKYKYIFGLIALFGILAIFALNPQPVNAYTGITTATATVVDTISVTLSYNDSGTAITFGSLNSGTTNNPATNYLIIHMDAVTNVATDINQSASDFNHSTDIIAVSNLGVSYDSTLGDAVPMTTSYPSTTPFSDWTNIASGTSKSAHYWLTIPNAQPAGDYQSTINIKVTKHL
jgi:hypothetical protein